jgi:subtilisin family serine protease
MGEIMEKKCTFFAFKILPSFLCLTLPLGIFADHKINNNTAEKADLKPQINYQRNSHPKMDQALWNLYLISQKKGLEAAFEYAEEKQITVFNGDIQLQIQTDEGASTSFLKNYDLKESVERLDGHLIYKHNSIYINIHPDLLLSLAANPQIRYLSVPKRPLENLYVTEGVELTGADHFINIPPYKTAQPVKVAVVDGGFYSYNYLIGNELPENTRLISLLNGGGPGTSIHGTGCAEIIHDMVPDAELHLIPVDDIPDLFEAVNYCLDQGIKIISMSLAWEGCGARDGTGWVCDAIKYAHDNGIIWCVAAGNQGQNHYTSYFSDTDGDGFHNTSADNELITFSRLQINNLPMYIMLEWEDWGEWNGNSYRGTGEDYDLFLYKWNGADWILVDKSENIQDGDDIGYEEIAVPVPEEGRYGIAVRKISGEKNVRLHVITWYTKYFDPQYVTSEGSLCVSADCEYAITAGGYYSFDSMLTPYSSRGPTRDGRIKPDFVAPTSVSCFSYRNSTTSYRDEPFVRGMGGTSAAQPHLAGAIALLESRLPYLTYDDIIAILIGRSIEEGDPGKDFAWGWGRLYMLP